MGDWQWALKYPCKVGLASYTIATIMNILLLAPHPFYQERGTPIAVDLLIRVLSERGDKIDVLTYHEGTHPDYGRNVRIFRIKPTSMTNNIRPGFTVKKLICDALMWPMAVQMCRQNKYDIVHAVEESVFMAMSIKRKLGIPYIMDMDSSMPEQIAEKMPLMKPILPVMRAFEKRAVCSASVVVPVCDALADVARKYGAANISILRDVSLAPSDPPSLQPLLKEELGIKGLCYMYIGNLERYQGIDLLLESFAIHQRQTGGADLVVIGGAKSDVARYEAKAASLGISDHAHFLGPKPVSMMGSFLREADVVVSPRITGGNTPMKVYSYLASGKAMLATKLSTHTQVLDDETAVLEPPESGPFAQGMIRLFQSSELRAKIGKNAAELARSRYSFDIYKRTLNGIYDGVVGGGKDET